MAHHYRSLERFKFDVAKEVRPPDATHCLKCGYHNFLGYSQQDIKRKVEATVVPVVNTILNPLGWQYLGTGVFGNYFELYYKEASPAEPVTISICASILWAIALIVLGLAIISVAWMLIRTAELKAEAKADKKKLLEEGKITSEQYKELIEAQAEEDMMKGLGDLFKWGIILLIVMAVAGALGKRRD